MAANNNGEEISKAETTDRNDCESGEGMVVLTTDQMRRLLGAIKKPVSFLQCTLRFHGQCDPGAVEGFLAAITAFKDCGKISDEDALLAMPLLLKDDAASWWLSVREQITTFKEAKEYIRNTFAPRLPDWRIISSIVGEKQQNMEPTDRFICKKRFLFAQLKDPIISEELKLNMVFGLLNVQIRERVRRDSINSFEELITECREAEMCIAEIRASTAEDEEADPNVASSTYYHKGSQTEKTCFKKLRKAEQQEQQTNQHQQSEAAASLVTNPTLSCYGCGAPGVFRAQCTTCNSNKNSNNNPKYIAFNLLSTSTIGHDLPTAHITVFGEKAEAIFDSGAKTSVAGEKLKKILTQNKCVFQDVKSEITLADGSITTDTVMSTICDIIIGNRKRNIRFIYLPNAKKNQTLLGIDFLQQAGIVLNIPQQYWYFESEPKTRFKFSNPKETELFTLDVEYENEYNADKNSKVDLIEYPKVISILPCTPKVPPNKDDYSPHSIQNIFSSVPVGSITPPERTTLSAPPAKLRRTE